MPAAVVKGILFTVSIIAALGLAVYEKPEVQRWLEEQRRRIAELLRSLGEELDPAARRQAEAFAFDARTPANDGGLRREAESSIDAAAVVTGRSLPNTVSVLRIPLSALVSDSEAEERRRQGREYLARRKQRMYELQQRRRAAEAEGTATPPTPTPTSFDALVDGDGKLKEPEMELLSPRPMSDALSKVPSVPEKVLEQLPESARSLLQPLLASESSSSAPGWQLGSRLANPFGDEYEMDRSETPRPPVPPKLALDTADPPTSAPALPEPESRPDLPLNRDELSYEEQLAIALSLSEAESSANSATVRQQRSEDEQDAELHAAIEASLNDMDDQQAAHAIANAEPQTPRLTAHDRGPLVDLIPDPPTSVPPTSPPNLVPWHDLLAQQWQLPTDRALSTTETEDELYRITPELTHARLASLNATPEDSHQEPQQTLQSSTPRYDPVREAAPAVYDFSSQEEAVEELGRRTESPFTLSQPVEMDSSFYSAPSSVRAPVMSRTMSPAQTPRLVDLSALAQQQGQAQPRLTGRNTATLTSSLGFHTDTESVCDSFASVSAPPSRAQSRTRSDRSGISNVVLVDVVEDSDVDVLSEEGDGVATPDSWSEVASRDADSEMASDDGQHREHGALL